jgi:hypothetical protein
MTFDDPTPAEAITAIWRWLPVLLLLLLVSGGLTIAGWQFGWWLTAQSVTRQAELTQNGYANQVTLRQQVTANFTTLTAITVQITANSRDSSLVTALRVQRAATGNQVCADAAQITGTALPASQARCVTANCVDGSLAVASSDYQAGQP